MSGRGGRDRSRRDYPLRSEEKTHQGRSNPPSRHLWVGNLSHSLTENELARHFLQFGELDSVAFQPGRSYAFVNYKNPEDAFASIRELQGFVVAGNPLRIEFAKAEKSPPPRPRDEDYLQRRDDQRPIIRGSTSTQRDSRSRLTGAGQPLDDRSNVNDKDAEPSEVLWIGFPAQLKVDEFILRKAFSPFGEIEKITAFPGRTYAFVCFRNVTSAIRAKDTLQGKLFGNPRVHICFAKSESGTSNKERSSLYAPSSPSFRSYRRLGSSEDFREDRSIGNMTGDFSIRSPHFISNFERDDPTVSFNHKNNIWAAENGGFDQERFPEAKTASGIQVHMYDHPTSPLRDRGPHFREFSPPKFSRQRPVYDDPWDLPEDSMLFHEPKKLKTISFQMENELPEYHLSDLEKAKHAAPKMYSDFRQSEAPNRNFDSGHFGYKLISDRMMNSTQPFEERSDRWIAPSGGVPAGSGLLVSNSERKRLTPELHQSSPNTEWKWEGTIAKGGSPVCRARCFPVGKVLDMPLPEFLDCTARTSLDMLTKHYYQAATAWVVFFVPASDPDIAFYNEFMNYLGEKQRAAVAKLDDITTLFLVPPSEFSEKVLKVPGKLSISGVILRLEQPGPSYGSFHDPHEKDMDVMSFNRDASYQPTSPTGPYTPAPSLPSFERPVTNIASLPGNFSGGFLSAPYSSSAHSMGNISDSVNEHQHAYVRQRNPAVAPNWSPHELQNLNSNARNIASQASSSSVISTGQVYNSLAPRMSQDASSDTYTTEIPSVHLGGGNRSSLHANMSAPLLTPDTALPAEQLAHLASSLLGQQRQTRAVMGDEFSQSNSMHQSGNSFPALQKHLTPNNQVAPDHSSSQFGHVQLQQQQLQQQQQHVPSLSHRELQPAAQVNQQLPNVGQDESDADPQKRLQATLQLAAALLQQIQQGKGTK